MVESNSNVRLTRIYIAAEILGSLINGILGLLIGGLAMMLIWFVGAGAESLAKDYRDDPVYKKKLRDLIERNREFEKKE